MDGHEPQLSDAADGPYARRSPGRRHIGATIAALVVQGLLVLGTGFVLAMFAMSSDACTRQLYCERPLVDVGFAVGLLGGAVLFVVCLVVSTVLMVKRRRSLWLPLVGCGVQLALLGIGVLLVVQPPVGS